MTGQRVTMAVVTDLRLDARVWREATALATGGYEVTIVSSCPIGRVGGTQMQHGVRTVEIPFSLQNLSGLPSFLRTMNKQLQVYQADIFHAHNVNVLPLCYWAARRQGAKLIYDSHEYWPGLVESQRWSIAWWKQRVERFIEARLIQAADAVITVNGSYARLIAEKYQIAEPVVVRNCPPLVPLVRTDELRRQCGLPASTRMVIYQGGYYLDTRGLIPVIEAIAQLAPGVHLAMVGFGLRGEEEILRQTAMRFGVADRVHMLAPVAHDQLLNLTMGADIGVIPFYDNSLAMHWCTPNKVYEYLIAGLAVASTDLPEIRAVLAPESLGDFFDATDPRSIATTLTRLLAGDLNGVKRRARLTAERLYHWELEVAGLLNLYDAVGAK